MLVILGLSLIVIAWIEQLWRAIAQKHLSFSPFFLVVYLVGTGVLAASSFTSFDAVPGALDVVAAVIAFIILVVLIYRRMRPGAF